MWEQLRINRELKSRFPMSLVYGPLHNTALWNLALAVRGRANAGRGRRALPAAPITSASDRQVAMLRERYRAGSSRFVIRSERATSTSPLPHFPPT